MLKRSKFSEPNIRQNSVYLEITHGDVTTAKDAGSSTILSMLGGILETYMKANLPKPFREIVHIMDMDGTYVLIA